MNFSQYAGALRPIFTGLVGLAVGRGWISPDAVGLAGQVAAFIVSVVGAGAWSAVANSTPNLAKVVAAEPGLKVLVDPTAAPALQMLARDPEIPDIVHAPLPRDPIYPPPDPPGLYQTRRNQ